MRQEMNGIGGSRMVRSIWIGVLSAALLSGVSQPLAAQSKPAAEKNAAETGLALKNPGFEEGGKAPAGWEEGTAIGGVEYVWDKKTGYKSPASVCIKKTAERYFPIAEWRQTVPNTGKTAKLRLSAWVKAEQAYKGILDVWFVGEDGKEMHQWAAYIGAKQPTDPPADHDWKEYSGVVAIPKGTKSIRIALQVYGPGTLWFDNVSAAYVPEDTPVSLYDEKGNPKPD